MSASRTIFGLAAIWAAGMAGCATSPWNAPHSSRAPSAPPVVQPASGPAPVSSAAVNSQGMQEVLAEIQRTGTLDLATQEQLIHDLQQVDPSLWPQMVLQFRAQLAYAQRAKQLATAATAATSSTATLASATPAPTAGTISTAASSTSSVQPVIYVARASGEQSVAPAVATTPVAATALSSSAATAASAGGTTTTSSNPAASEMPADWRKHLNAAIAAKEAQLKADGKGEHDEARQAQLRMLYLLAGRREDALRPIPATSAAAQGFWSEQLYGLATMVDEQAAGDSNRRTAEAKQHLDDALARLRERCPLAVRNLAFCKRIESFGCVELFEDADFSAGQLVLLYAELENLVSQSTARGQHTAIRSSYQIFDQRGLQLTEEQFTMSEEYCRRVRRDYYVSYKLYLPEKIVPGKYTLKLTVEDLTGHNVAQSSLDFSIKKSR